MLCEFLVLRNQLVEFRHDQRGEQGCCPVRRVPEQVHGPVRDGEQGRGPVRHAGRPRQLAVRLRRLGKVNAWVLKGEFRQLWPAHMILFNLLIRSIFEVQNRGTIIHINTVLIFLCDA